eukprot:TRINITY_DN22518_c0_g1_i1.p1 TRINITY_DN22518_c0_g1~~TRINITY_DN22518_c0_g1_i1.p1  ORF type:complete len:1019 (-),score=229.16 TRINITY_DN22518_c0_g1_i1:296-3352(-)
MALSANAAPFHFFESDTQQAAGWQAYAQQGFEEYGQFRFEASSHHAPTPSATRKVNWGESARKAATDSSRPSEQAEEEVHGSSVSEAVQGGPKMGETVAENGSSCAVEYHRPTYVNSCGGANAAATSWERPLRIGAKRLRVWLVMNGGKPLEAKELKVSANDNVSSLLQRASQVFKVPFSDVSLEIAGTSLTDSDDLFKACCSPGTEATYRVRATAQTLLDQFAALVTNEPKSVKELAHTYSLKHLTDARRALQLLGFNGRSFKEGLEALLSLAKMGKEQQVVPLQLTAGGYVGLRRGGSGDCKAVPEDSALEAEGEGCCQCNSLSRTSTHVGDACGISRTSSLSGDSSSLSRSSSYETAVGKRIIHLDATVEVISQARKVTWVSTPLSDTATTAESDNDVLDISNRCGDGEQPMISQDAPEVTRAMKKGDCCGTPPSEAATTGESDNDLLDVDHITDDCHQRIGTFDAAVEVSKDIPEEDCAVTPPPEEATTAESDNDLRDCGARGAERDQCCVRLDTSLKVTKKVSKGRCAGTPLSEAPTTAESDNDLLDIGNRHGHDSEADLATICDNQLPALAVLRQGDTSDEEELRSCASTISSSDFKEAIASLDELATIDMPCPPPSAVDEKETPFAMHQLQQRRKSVRSLPPSEIAKLPCAAVDDQAPSSLEDLATPTDVPADLPQLEAEQKGKPFAVRELLLWRESTEPLLPSETARLPRAVVGGQAGSPKAKGRRSADYQLPALCKSERPRTTNDKEQTMRKINALLNKLTPEKFDKLLAELTCHLTAQPDCLEGFVQAVVEKASTQHKFGGLYADLCRKVHDHFSASTRADAKSGSSRLKNVLLARIKNGFIERPNLSAASVSDPEEAVFQADQFKLRMKGNMQFMGELVIRSMLVSKIFALAVEDLLCDPSDAAAECLCALLTVCGALLDKSDSKHYDFLATVFKKITALTRDKTRSTRARCLFMDVLDLRANGWQDMKKASGPKPAKLSSSTRMPSNARGRQSTGRASSGTHLSFQ